MNNGIHKSLAVILKYFITKFNIHLNLLHFNNRNNSKKQPKRANKFAKIVRLFIAHVTKLYYIIKMNDLIIDRLTIQCQITVNRN